MISLIFYIRCHLYHNSYEYIYDFMNLHSLIHSQSSYKRKYEIVVNAVKEVELIFSTHDHEQQLNLGLNAVHDLALNNRYLF
jgi:hypothetical protein